jgi:hypothetical protein
MNDTRLLLQGGAHCGRCGGARTGAGAVLGTSPTSGAGLRAVPGGGGGGELGTQGTALGLQRVAPARTQGGRGGDDGASW